MTQGKKWIGMFGLACVWLVLVYILVIDVSPPREVPLRFISGQSPVSPVHQISGDGWEVRLLHPKVRELPGTPKKNIFAVPALPRSQEAQVRLAAVKNKRTTATVPQPLITSSSPPPSPSLEDLARQQEALAVQAARQQEELRRKQLQDQMAQYRYLGYLTQGGDQQAFLSMGSDIFIVKPGETLAGSFVVSSMSGQEIKIQDPKNKLEVVIPLKRGGVATPF